MNYARVKVAPGTTTRGYSMGWKTLRQARRESGLTAQAAATAAGCDRATLYRLEKGEHLPTRRTARALFELYGGAVPLGFIYDPDFYRALDAAA